MTTSFYYTIDDFQKIFSQDFKSNLTTDVIKIISNLNKEFINSGSTPEQKPFFLKKNTDYKNNTKTDNNSTFHSNIMLKNKAMNKEICKEADSETWFQPKLKITKIEKKEGTELIMNEIKISLNKLSNKNFETQKKTIIELINKMLNESNEKEADIKKTSKMIFDIASSNKFYSYLYAELYEILSSEFSEFKLEIYDIMKNHKMIFEKMAFVENNGEGEDYDCFCETNKKNDIIRAMTTFILNLNKKDMIHNDDIIEFIIFLQNLVLKYSQEENKTSEIDEITENIYILIKEHDAKLEKNILWEQTVIHNVYKIAQLKKNEPLTTKSLSSRSVFKYMDIIDKIFPKKK